MKYHTLRKSTAVAFAPAAAAAARGDLVQILSGATSVSVHLPGAHVAFDLDVRAEAPIELHSHRATLIVIPIEVVALETATHIPKFIGSIELSCSDDRTFDVVLEGEFEGPFRRAADLVPAEEILEAVLDEFADRIERHVVSSDPTLGIPF
ncbi:MAG TPA: hypothetical protein VIW46_00885 [Acidimicrobiia bacterium]|jgi:hypothetical protein